MAQKLTDLEVDRVDGVGRGANNRGFMVKKAAEDEESIQEEAPEAPDELSWEDEDVSKSAEGGLKAWARNIIRKVAGLPGPERGDTDMGMTADEVKQAMREAVDEGLAPFDERLSVVEKAATEAAEGDGTESVEKAVPPQFVKCSKCGASIDVSKCDKVEKADTIDEAPVVKSAEVITPEAIAKAVTEAVGEAIKPLDERLGIIEKAAGQRQSGVAKSAADIAAEGKAKSPWAGVL